MPKENERKFLVDPTLLPVLAPGVEYRQGYLSRNSNASVRIRLLTPPSPAAQSARITIKGPGLASRDEYEYSISVTEAIELLDNLCLPGEIHKTRHTLVLGPHTFEIDFFTSPRPGLILAEVELLSLGEDVTIPPWVTVEVTGDPAYSNAELSRVPE